LFHCVFLTGLVGWFEDWSEKLYVHRNIYFELLNEICNLRTIHAKRPMVFPLHTKEGYLFTV
jgi:hypothetical protein